MYAIKQSFSAGEISPKLYGRVDLNQYQIGLKTCQNFMVEKQGSISNRPGTEFLHDFGLYPYQYDTFRLVPFNFSTTETYVLVFSNTLEIFIFKDGEIITSGGFPVVIETPYNVPPSELDFAQSGDMLFVVHQNFPPYRLLRYSDTSWVFEEIPLTDGPYSTPLPEDTNISMTPGAAGGETTLTASDDVFTQDMVGTLLRLGYEDPEDPTYIAWTTVTIDSVGSATLANITINDTLGSDYLFNGDFVSGLAGWENWSRDNIEPPSGVSGTAEFNADDNSVIFTNNEGIIVQPLDYYPPTTWMSVTIDYEFLQHDSDVEAFIAVEGAEYDTLKTNDWGKYIFRWVAASATATGLNVREVSSYSFRTPAEGKFSIAVHGAWGDNVTGDNKVKLYSVSVTRSGYATTNWRRFAWGPLNYPSRISFHEQRLCFASNASHPQTIWMSRSGNFYDFGFSSPGADDDSVTLNLASYKIDAIQWMISATDLIVGTYSAIWKIAAGSQTDSITPTSITAKIQTSEGCSTFEPLQAGASLLYVQRGDTVIRDLAYSFETDSFRGRDLTIASSHLFEDTAVRSWDFEPISQIVWVVLTSGKLLGLTYVAEQEMVAWHRHETMNNYDKFVDVCVLEEEDGDHIYFLKWVKQGTTQTGHICLERFLPRRTYRNIQTPEYTSYTDHFPLMDSAVDLYSQAGFEPTLTGLDHLNGRQVYALLDGDLSGPYTVSGGDIIVPYAGFHSAHVGIPYASWAQTLDLFLNDNFGASTGRRLRVARINIKLYRTRGLNIGTTETDLMPIKMREPEDRSSAPEAKEGVFDISITNGWNEQGSIMIYTAEPVPITILAIIPEVELASR